METRYDEIKNAYLQFEKSLLKQGKLVMRTTEKGFWGVALLDDLYEFFQKMHLEKHKHFLDLGSGDGRMVAVASLFTKATGIEFDNELVNTSKKITSSLKLNCEFKEKDFLEEDFSKYDFIMVYPDNLFTLELEKKFKEFKGRFFVYNNIYRPNHMKKGKTIWINQMPIIEFYWEE